MTDHLRAAIQEANNQPGMQAIQFDIPACSGGICVLDIATAGGNALPDIQSPTIIDGDPDGVDGSDGIVVLGNFIGTDRDGLVDLGDRLVATATDVDGNTSEFSASVEIVFLDRIFLDGFDQGTCPESRPLRPRPAFEPGWIRGLGEISWPRAGSGSGTPVHRRFG